MPQWHAVFLSHANSGPHRLRELLTQPSPILAPGAFDCFSARLIEAAGFPAVYMTGFGTAASHLGRPDVGLLGMSEMVDQARRIVASVQVPLIADADTGYGNPINVVRTVKAYEDAGVAALHLEDQVAPKRCGHMPGKQVIAPAEMVAKIEAAVAARRSADFTIIARTDARAVEGLDPALERAWQYKDAGADVIFVEALESLEEVERVAEAFRDVPLLFNWTEGGRTPPVPYSRLRELGFRIVIFPIGALLIAGRAISDLLETLQRDGTPVAAMDRMMRFQEVIDFLGVPEMRALEERFAETPRGSADSS
jgi:carboxyvinyl-carboxyphosphonate phosphorylmutase